MAWTEDMVSMLRVIINDTESPQTYENDRLRNLLMVAAMYVKQEVDFDVVYTIGISNVTLAPDPTLTATRDDSFTNLVVLKAACLTDQSTLRTKAIMSGIEAKCGPAMLKTLKHLDGFKELLTLGPCAAYEQLKHDYKLNDTTNLFGILSPFISDDFDPNYLTIGDEFRS